jgi:hypothetical protein
VGQGVLAAGEGDPARVPTGAEDELRASQTPSVAEHEGMRIEEAGVAGVVERADARGFELTP